jgi:hypothetical protein
MEEEELIARLESAPPAGPACEGVLDVALFLPFGNSKGRQSSAKPGKWRNRKIARFCGG